MAKYEIRLDASSTNIAEQIEALQGIGAVELVFSIEAPTRAKAIRETISTIEEFDATYHGTWTSDAKKDAIHEGMKLVRKSRAK